MGFFKSTPFPFAEARVNELVEKISELAAQLAEAQGEYDAIGTATKLERQIATLEKSKADLELELDGIREQHDRETREIEHKIGLHKKQVEHEISVARTETELKVKTENLKAEKDRFAGEMKFMRERMDAEVNDLRDMVRQVLEHLPKVQVNRNYNTNEQFGEVPAAIEAAKD